jgi:hypothetical protein
VVQQDRTVNQQKSVPKIKHHCGFAQALPNKTISPKS